MEPLATSRELELHLQRDLANPEAAELALALASGAVRAYCGWNLARETTTFEVDGDDSQVLTLPTLHLHDLIEFKNNNVVVAHGDGRYPLWSRKGQLYRIQGWPRHMSFQATVIHGYDPLPDLVKLVTLDLAARSMSNPEGLVSATVGPVSRTWASSGSDPTHLSTLHTRLLDRYSI